MAHFILEYSANIADEVKLPELFRALHATAMATDVFQLGGIRFRAVRCDDYLIADGDPANAFVHLTLKMGHGRTPEVQRATAEKLFATLKEQLCPIFDKRPFGLSFEVTELSETLNFKENNIHERLKKK